MRLMILIISLAVMFVIFGCGEKKQAVIEDIVETNPDNAKLILENDYVKAVAFMLKPGEKLPLHKGKPRAVYALSDYTVMWTEGENTSEKNWQNGAAHWHEAIAHAIENTGDSDAHYLTVSRKATALPETGDYDAAHDASAVDTTHSHMVFENDNVRIIKTIIPPGESQPMHHGINRMIYALSDYQIKYDSDKAEAKESQIAAGTAHWHSADEHMVENVGTSPAEYVIFAFKK